MTEVIERVTVGVLNFTLQDVMDILAKGKTSVNAATKFASKTEFKDSFKSFGTFGVWLAAHDKFRAVDSTTLLKAFAYAWLHVVNGFSITDAEGYIADCRKVDAKGNTWIISAVDAFDKEDLLEAVAEHNEEVKQFALVSGNSMIQSLNTFNKSAETIKTAMDQGMSLTLAAAYIEKFEETLNSLKKSVEARK
jgi:hypothetical protein